MKGFLSVIIVRFPQNSLILILFPDLLFNLLDKTRAMSAIIEKKSHPFLIISGQIPTNKKIEFEHTFRVGFSSLSKDCISKSLSEDCEQEGVYYFFSMWSNADALQNFMESLEFQLLNGAFHALGYVGQNVHGNILRSEPQIHISLS